MRVAGNPIGKVRIMSSSSSDNAMNERAQHLLKVLVERYIHAGEPVGSRTLAKDSGLELSPASIRNIMADLEDMGMVQSPHTSAGRIPTVRGYRFFVDTLLTVQPLDVREMRKLTAKLQAEAGDSQALLSSVSNLLSGLTSMAGLVTMPDPRHAAWRHIEFLPLSDRRALAILVVNDGEVQNRVLKLDRDYSQSELQQASNYLNQHFAGRHIDEIRRLLLKDLRETRQSVNAMMLNAVSMAEQTLADEDGGGYVLAGETNLMDFAELSNVEKLRRLFDAFNQKRDLLHLLDRCAGADGVQIFIGDESGYQVLDECSVVTAPYKVEDEVLGVLGVIGPTRMAYERVIPIVDMTAKLLGSALNSRK